MSIRRWSCVCIAVASLTLAGRVRAEEDAGEDPHHTALKGRSTAPTATQVDPAVTLESMLAATDEHALSTSKGAAITGYVIQSEKEEDGDVHLVLADARGETSTTKWVIVEVPASWQKKKSSSLGASHLRKLIGHRVKATGWLYYEPDTDSADPRGTRWELHPVTSIVRLDAAPSK